MKQWTDDFLAQCLEGIPNDPYRSRTKAELEDHLSELARELQSAGHAPAEAQALALNVMGDPLALNRMYQERFAQRRLRDPRLVCKEFFRLSLLTGIYYLFAMLFLGWIGFTHDASFPDRVCYPLYGHPERQYIYGAVVFFLPFSLNAFHLRRSFRLHPHPAAIVTAGLLFTWICEKLGLILLNTMLGSNSLMEVLAGGWCDASPWLNLSYFIGSFLGCLSLGFLFSIPKSKA